MHPAGIEPATPILKVWYSTAELRVLLLFETHLLHQFCVGMYIVVTVRTHQITFF